MTENHKTIEMHERDYISVEDPQHVPPPQEQQLIGVHVTKNIRKQCSRAQNRRSSLHGPLRALRLCVLCVIIPSALVSIPLYLRYHVYNRQEYPASVSDMRMINAHVSTTWCQTQVVRANATFNAYVVDGTPSVMNDRRQRVEMSRQLVLEDDMKEYWAFYLLKGSTVTVSTCVRWQGASLIIIKGHKHLRECAYIGDDSSEEEDEIEEERRTTANDHEVKVNSSTSDETNTPKLMRRAGPGVLLHHLQQPLKSSEQLRKDYSDNTSEEEDNVLARLLLRKATNHARVKAMSKHPIKGKVQVKTSVNDTKLTPDSSVRPPTSLEVFEEVLKSLKQLGARGTAVLQKLNNKLGEDGGNEFNMKIKQLLEEHTSEKGVLSDTKNADQIEQDSGVVDKKVDTKLTDADGLLLHDDTKTVREGISNLQTIAEDMKTHPDGDLDVMHPDGGSVPMERKIQDSEKESAAKRRREIVIGGSSLHVLLNKHDVDEDHAIEEDLEPDGIADHHRTLNQTTKGDHSNSEFWSSFSSSEEALLQCAGLVLNLPLTPHRHCEKHRTPQNHEDASLANTITYKVSSTGYYFFVFSSENEIQPNYFRVHFDLEKTMYDVSHAIAECKNSTADCELPLGFWSYDTVVLELPVGSNDASWREDFVVYSTCVPRTAVYLVCILSVPLIILLCAFY